MEPFLWITEELLIIFQLRFGSKSPTLRHHPFVLLGQQIQCKCAKGNMLMPTEEFICLISMSGALVHTILLGAFKLWLQFSAKNHPCFQNMLRLLDPRLHSPTLVLLSPSLHTQAFHLSRDRQQPTTNLISTLHIHPWVKHPRIRLLLPQRHLNRRHTLLIQDTHHQVRLECHLTTPRIRPHQCKHLICSNNNQLSTTLWFVLRC